MENKILTVFTPAYNRGYCIHNLYESLLRQEKQNFVWHIVDDGSTDNTREIVSQWIADNKIPIIYDYQENAGKHVAHNLGVEKCETDLFFCVDSDDELTDDATEIIDKEWCALKEQNLEKISGMIMYRVHRSGKLICSEFPADIKISKLSDLYRAGFYGDTALVFISEVIKKYSFPVFKGERFMRENILYDMIDKNYKMKLVGRGIYICEYLDDGLSRNATKMEMKSPKGAAVYRLGEADKTNDMKKKVRNYSAFLLFSLIAHDGRNAVKQLGIIKTIFLLPVACAGYMRYKIKGVM